MEANSDTGAHNLHFCDAFGIIFLCEKAAPNYIQKLVGFRWVCPW